LELEVANGMNKLTQYVKHTIERKWGSNFW